MPLMVATLFVGSLVVVVHTLRCVRRRRTRAAWMAITSVLLFAGSAGGVYLSTEELQMSSRLRLVGLPLPLGVFFREQDQWTDFVHSTSLTWAILVTDVMFWAALAVVPVLIATKLTAGEGRENG